MGQVREGGRVQLQVAVSGHRDLQCTWHHVTHSARLVAAGWPAVKCLKTRKPSLSHYHEMHKEYCA